MFKRILVKKHWFCINNNWHLMVEVDNRVFSKTLIMYDTVGEHFDERLKLNKILRENDLIEKIHNETGIKVEFTE